MDVFFILRKTKIKSLQDKNFFCNADADANVDADADAMMQIPRFPNGPFKVK